MAEFHSLKVSLDTVSWGFFDNSLKPVLTVKPGDLLEIETVSQSAGFAPDLMMDEQIREIYETVPVEDRGPGNHIPTGPVFVEGAKEGDVLEVKVLDMWPRLPYGCNFISNNGMLSNDFDRKQHVVIYKVDMASQLARAEFQFPDWAEKNSPGRITEPDRVKRMPALKNVYVPLRLHFGIAGLAPKASGKVTTRMPGSFGGNVDNRNFIAGTSMLYPVQVDGGLFTACDGHFAEGDGELSGTAIEGNLNALLQFNIRKDIKLSLNPVLITPTHYIVHGMHEDLDEAMRLCALEGVEFLCKNKNLSREEAYSILSVSGDFQISQAVNKVKGVHCKIRRNMFVPAE